MEKKKKTGGRIARHCAFLGLCLLIPATMGGCPEFQNSATSAIETAARGVLDAGLDLFFDQFRSGQAP